MTRRTDMYKTTFVYRDGHHAVFRFDGYDTARRLLLQGCIACEEELLYALVSYHSLGCRYTTDIVDRRFRTDGRIISLGDLMSIRIIEDFCVSECCVDEIDAAGGRLRVTVFSNEITEGWHGLEEFL